MTHPPFQKMRNHNHKKKTKKYQFRKNAVAYKVFGLLIFLVVGRNLNQSMSISYVDDDSTIIIDLPNNKVNRSFQPPLPPQLQQRSKVVTLPNHNDHPGDDDEKVVGSSNISFSGGIRSNHSGNNDKSSGTMTTPSAAAFVTTNTKGSSFFSSNNKNNNVYLGCKEISQLEVVKVLGVGYRKVAYEVKLPGSGSRRRKQHAVAKRCKNLNCIHDNSIVNETQWIRRLYEEYGSTTDNGGGAVEYYGQCNDHPIDNVSGFPKVLSNEQEMELNMKNISNAKRRKRKNDLLMKLQNEFIEENWSNFQIGFTSVVELGQPLMDSWNIFDHVWRFKCFASFFASRDIEDLKNIARRYAYFPDTPLLLQHIHNNSRQFTDNQFPQQYMTRIVDADSDDGDDTSRTIHHVDFDMVLPCYEYYDPESCSREHVLEVNCDVMSKLANLEYLDCSLPVNNTINTTKNDKRWMKTPLLYPMPNNEHGDDDHRERINATYAIEACLRSNQTMYEGRRRKKQHKKEQQPTEAKQRFQDFLSKKKTTTVIKKSLQDFLNNKKNAQR